MAKKRKTVESPTYDFLSIGVDNFSISTDCSIPYEVRDDKQRTEDMQVFSFGSHIAISGTCRYPPERADGKYDFVIYSGVRHAHVSTRLVKDYRAVDDNYQMIYRRVRGKELPVYHLPDGIGYLEKQRGSDCWYSAIWIDRLASSDMITMLSQFSHIYIAVHEMKKGRSRSVLSFSLQTNDPAEE